MSTIINQWNCAFEQLDYQQIRKLEIQGKRAYSLESDQTICLCEQAIINQKFKFLRWLIIHGSFNYKEIRYKYMMIYSNQSK